MLKDPRRVYIISLVVTLILQLVNDQDLVVEPGHRILLLKSLCQAL